MITHSSARQQGIENSESTHRFVVLLASSRAASATLVLADARVNVVDAQKHARGLDKTMRRRKRHTDTISTRLLANSVGSRTKQSALNTHTTEPRSTQKRAETTRQERTRQAHLNRGFDGLALDQVRLEDFEVLHVSKLACTKKRNTAISTAKKRIEEQTFDSINAGS